MDGGGIKSRRSSETSAGSSDQVSTSSDSDSDISTTSSSSLRSFYGASVTPVTSCKIMPAPQPVSDEPPIVTRLRVDSLDVARLRMSFKKTGGKQSSPEASSKEEVHKSTLSKQIPGQEVKDGRLSQQKAKYKALREKNREDIPKLVDLNNPNSLGSQVFLANTNVRAELIEEYEKIYLQETMQRHLEAHLNSSKLGAEALTIIAKVAVKRGLAAQTFPSLADWVQGKSGGERKDKNAFVLSQLNVPKPRDLSTPEAKRSAAETSLLWAQIRPKMVALPPLLRTQYWEEIFKGTEEEQKAAYLRLNNSLEEAKRSLEESLQELRRRSAEIDDFSGFFSAVESSLNEGIEQINKQQAVLGQYEQSDFRKQKFYREEMQLTLGSVDKFLASDQVKQLKAKSKRKAIDTLQQLAGEARDLLSKVKDEELRPTIIADMKEFKEQCLELARKADLHKQLKKKMMEDRMAQTWSPVVQKIPARRGVHTELFESINEPLEAAFGRKGCVPSTAQSIDDRPCNAWGHILKAPDGQGVLNKCVRSAVPTPYQLKKKLFERKTPEVRALEERRKAGAAERARQQLVYSLMMECGGSAEKLEKICGTPETAAVCPVMLISYLTTDKMRSKAHVHDDELNMQLEAIEGFSSLVGTDGEISELKFIDKDDMQRTIYLKPKLVAFNCACNSIAFGYGVMFPWAESDKLNQESIKKMTGSDLPEDPVTGWVGEALQSYQGKYGRSHPQQTTILKKVKEWRTFLLLEEHHSENIDTFKAANFPGLIAALLREDNPAVLADIEQAKAGSSAQQASGSVAPGAGAPFPGKGKHDFPIQTFGFCKSGKDRTGAGMGSLDREVTEYYMDSVATPCEPTISLDRQFNAQNYAMFVQVKVQHENGAMGYKTTGEDNLIGPTVKQARKHSSKPAVEIEVKAGKKPKKSKS